VKEKRSFADKKPTFSFYFVLVFFGQWIEIDWMFLIFFIFFLMMLLISLIRWPMASLLVICVID